MTAEASRPFAAAVSHQPDWQANAADLARQLAGAPGQLGVLYCSGGLADHLAQMCDLLKRDSGITEWVAATGYGVITGDDEHFGEVAATAMVLDVAADSYRVFAGGSDAGANLAASHGDWIAEAVMPLALVHVDPRDPQASDAIDRFAADAKSYLVGGLTLAEGTPHLAGNSQACLSGVAFSPAAVAMATGLSQGCTPLTEPRIAGKVEQNILIEIDGRPALDVFMEDVGPELAADLNKCAGVIFAARPVLGSDTADYTVRNLVGIDPSQKLIAIADTLEDGDPIMFCRRDPETAIVDMQRMVDGLKRRVGKNPIRGGLYISCAARGPNQFTAPEREIDLIRATLGDFPIAGFFANGEISRDRIYAYTGVLTLFL